jgi:peptidyl-prolyl cis-trans isomerase C
MFKRNAYILGATIAMTAAMPLMAQETQSDIVTETEAPAENTAENQTEAVAKVDMIDVQGDTVLATVNGQDITMAQAIVTRMGLPEQFQSLPAEVIFPGVIEQLIQQEVLAQAIEGLSQRSEIQLTNQRRQLGANDKVDEIMAMPVDEAAVKAAYDAQYSAVEPEKEYHAAHILVETEEKIKELIALLDGGADFTELAKEHSTGPSGPSGGDLGWFGLGMMVKPFEDAVMTLEAGQNSGPVKTQFGWHVVKLNETRMKAAPTLDEVRDELIAKIHADNVDMELQKLLDAAQIDRINVETVNPAALQDLSLLDQ